MGKLRMKETPQDRLLEKEERQSRRHGSSKKRRRHRSATDSDDPVASTSCSSKHFRPSPLPEDDDYVPPRPPADRPYVPYTFDDDDEEGRLPSSSAHKSDKQRAQAEEEAFQEKLFDAMRDDEAFDPWSDSARTGGVSYDYRENLPDVNAFGRRKVMNDQYVDPETGVIVNRVIFKDAMSDEQYAEHIRAGMYRRTRREELARLEAVEASRKRKAQQKAEELARFAAAEAERESLRLERARRKAAQGKTKTREAYQAAWARLVDPSRQTEQLRMEDFPWPISLQSADTGGGEGGRLDRESVRLFLTAHLDLVEGERDRKKEKMAVRTAVLAYHPDRFDRYVMRVKEGKERDAVRQMGLQVSQILNELLQEI